MKKRMRTEQKSNVKNSIRRLAFVAISVLIQLVWILEQFIRLNRYSTAISLISSLLALLLVLRIYGKQQNSAFKMSWTVLILVFPVMGLCFYALAANKDATKPMRRRYEAIDGKLFGRLTQDPAVMHHLEQTDFAAANQCRYIYNYGKFPVYENTEVAFYSEAAEGFEEQLRQMREAKEFIFLEYHAIEEAEAFGRMRDVLAERAAAGVEVRILYDDVGSIGFIGLDFIHRMEALGIACRVFNPVLPVIKVFMNNRDHRKITVIDGKVGFTGGYNLADEYFNITHPYGRWKDTGVKLTGGAVQTLTALFLEMWNASVRGQQEESGWEKYLEAAGAGRLPAAAQFSGQKVSAARERADEAAVAQDEQKLDALETGFVQPYADSPLDDEYMGENVYLNLIKSAKHRFYAATPYLIISDEMTRELGLAAKRGVDVRIITPGIPDKKLIYKVTRSYYAGLAMQGVRIYEYTPGFIHAKQTFCDGVAATVGTINMDYRSLYHHFENGVFLYGCPAVEQIGEDFAQLFPVCREVTEQYRSGRSTVLRIAQCVLRLFAPLL